MFLTNVELIPTEWMFCRVLFQIVRFLKLCRVLKRYTLQQHAFVKITTKMVNILQSQFAKLKQTIYIYFYTYQNLWNAVNTVNEFKLNVRVLFIRWIRGNNKNNSHKLTGTHQTVRVPTTSYICWLIPQNA